MPRSPSSLDSDVLQIVFLKCKLKLCDVVTPSPTIGFNLDTAEYNIMHINGWDVGGHANIRMCWWLNVHCIQGMRLCCFLFELGSQSFGYMNLIQFRLHVAFGRVPHIVEGTISNNMNQLQH